MRPLPALLAALLALPLAAHAATYRWIDDNGRVVYGDAPPPSARQVRQLDEAAGRVSTIEAVPAEQLQRDRERVLQARLDRLEREIDELRRAPVQVPVPVQVSPPFYASPVFWGAPVAVAPVRFRPPFRVVHAPRPLPPRGGIRVTVRR